MVVSYAQTEGGKKTKAERKSEKERLKKENQIKENARWVLIQEKAESREFVIEIERVGNNAVSKRLNFVSVRNNRVIIQFETSSYSSENGLGGVTFDGTIANYKYTSAKNDNKPLYVCFDASINGTSRDIRVFISVTKSGRAVVTYNSGTENQGFFMPPDEANIIIGVDMWD